MSFVGVGSVLFLALFIVAPLGAAILVGALTRGRARTLGVAGFGVLAVEGALGLAWVLLLPRLAGDLSASLTLLSGAYSAVRGLLTLVAIALLLFAVVVDRSRAPEAPAYPT